ncbi:MAG: type II and III secretion system protein [Candidatus Brocadiaceae bacterium]|nr:type II and III secretion system protein [Candidatus Brocadiaceae bacterium]
MKNRSILISIFILSLFLLLFVPYQSLSQNKDTSEADPSTTNNYYLKTAKIYFEQKDYTKSVDALELAILLEPNNEEVLALLKQSRQLREEINKSIAMSDKTGGIKETKAAHPEDISQLIQNAYTAIQEERYDDAAKIADLMLTMDSANKEALYIKEKVNDIKHKHTTENLKTTLAQEKLKSHEYLKEASVPYQDTLRFPAKEQWADIAKRTLPELDKIVEENKIKTEQLRLILNPPEGPFPKVIEDALNTIISFEFLDTPLRDIIIFIREKTNINMIIDSEAGNVPITLKLKDVPFRTALKYILPKGYEYVIEGDIIHFYKQKMEMRVYDVRDILINLDDKEPLKFDITAAATSQMGFSKGAETVKAKDPSERVLDLIELIVTTVEPSSWSHRVSVVGASATGVQRSINIPGQGEGSVIARTGQPGDLAVVNSKYVHKQIEDLLASLRSSQNLQVSIEARFITVTDEFMEDIGSNITELFSGKTKVDTGAANITNGLNLNYSMLSNTMVEGFINAVQESKDAEILTSPRITLSNTQRGNIAVVTVINYIKTTAVSEGVTTPEIGTIPKGTMLDVRPVVSADRKYIYLEVTPSVFEVGDPIDEETVESSVTIPGTVINNVVTSKITVKLPEVTVSQVSVTVCVPDKGTLIIGGLGSINRDNTTTGIPILSKIPVLKLLFTRNQKNNKKSNLIILLKPTIIIREEQEANFLSLSNRNFNATDSNNR